MTKAGWSARWMTLALANEIMFDAIVLKVDELHGPLRSFYEKLKTYLKKQGGDNAQKMDFRQREIRQASAPE